VLRSLRRVYDGVAERHGRRTAGAPKALVVALSFCRLLGLGCPKQAFAKIATPREDIAFGLCDLGMGYPELGSVSLSEIQSLRGPGGLTIERDLHFEGIKPLSEYAVEARAKGRITV
jgi:DUF2958 family protein